MRNLIVVLFLGLMAVAVPRNTDAAGFKLGVLKCHQVQGSVVNLLIHSTVEMNCLFTSITGERQALYKG